MADANQLLNFQRKLKVYENEVVLTFSDKPQDIRITWISSLIPQVNLINKDSYQIQPLKIVDFTAVYGIIKLQISHYLIVFTKTKIVGNILQGQIFQGEQVQFIQLDNKQNSSDTIYINMLTLLFNTKRFYFSDKYDLTNSLQRQYNGLQSGEFFINEHLIWQFKVANAIEYVPRFISGLCEIKYIRLNNKECELILITRRDKRRMGRRFISRGADLSGNCSNFAETEQILRDGGNYYAFLQTRGSMPFKWKQKPNLKWAPKGQPLGDESVNRIICRRHFEQSPFQMNQVVINLIDKKGNQKLLGEYFQKMTQPLGIKHIWFDFHHECKKMKYENISKLLDQIKVNLEQYGYFTLRVDLKQKGPEQSGIMRTNCMDCLDRTNVVQSVVGRYMLWQVLQNIGIKKPGNGAFEAFPLQLEEAFRDIWTNNADVVSLLYTGTGALKTDFTKTGKRTKQGSIQDGKNSVIRYFLGNFYDADYQDAIDLLTGKLEPAQNQFGPNFVGLPLLVYYGLSKISNHPKFLTFLDIRQPQELTSSIKFSGILIFSILATIFLLKTIIMSNYGKFVKKPRIDH